MFSNMRRRMKDNRGFNMIELMVVVVIIGILAAIAVPIYSKYAKNARVTEATGRIGDLLTAAKSYAIENDTDGVPTTATWPACTSASASPNFIGECSDSQNFSYVATGGSTFKVVATGKSGTPMAGPPAVTVTLTISDPTQNGTIVVTGL